MKKSKAKKSASFGLPVIAAAGALALGFTPAAAQQSNKSSAQQSQSSSAMLSANSLNGAKVLDNQNREIGEITGVFINPQSGKIESANVDLDQNLFSGGPKYSIKWDQLSVRRNSDNNIVAGLDQSVMQRLQRVKEGNREASQQYNRDSANQRTGSMATSESRQSTSNSQTRPEQASSTDRSNQQQQRLSSSDLSAHGIRQIQQKLNKEGFDAGHVNGEWNQNTQTALKNYQQSKGLQSTGQLDQQTLDKLGFDRDDLRANSQ